MLPPSSIHNDTATVTLLRMPNTSALQGLSIVIVVTQRDELGVFEVIGARHPLAGRLLFTDAAGLTILNCR
jgi:hypothetical protein